MSALEEESASVRDASVLDATKSSQTGFPFLSLPPEIRNMIYQYLFTSVRDGTCLQIHTDWNGARLKGVRSDCFLCRSRLSHKTCQSSYVSVDDMHLAFECACNLTRSGILRMCKTLMRKALPVSLACMHIVFSHHFNDVKHISDALKVFLARTHQPKGVYLSVVTFIKYESSWEDEFDAKRFSQPLNEADIRIGHLILCETTLGVHPNIGKYFVEAIEHLEHKPAKIEWTYYYTEEAYGYETQRVEFNAAAERWLAQLAKIKQNAPPDAHVRLRDFLPHFSENTTETEQI